MAKKQDRNLAPRQLEHLKVMRRNGERLNMLIDDLLDISRVDSGNFMLEIAEFDVVKMLYEVVKGFEPVLAMKHQTLDAKLPPAGFWLDADESRLEQVVGNLLSNASKYSAPGTEIKLIAEPVDDRVSISVTDHGFGISDEDLGKVFMLFFRAKHEATRAVPGTGLGLAIAKAIIEMHHGEISVESSLGRGTTARFSVPGVLTGPEATSI